MNIIKWDQSQIDDLNIFCKKAGDAGIVNNSSIEKMSFQNKKNVSLYLVYIENNIAGVSYVHELEGYKENVYRVGTRTCVLPEYRKFKLHFPKASLAQAIGITAYTIKHQWDFAKSCGAQKIVWTTNCQGDYHSVKMDKYLHKFAHRNTQYYRHIENTVLYNTNQSVWELLTGDIT